MREVKSKKQTVYPVPVSNIMPVGKEGFEMAFQIVCQWSAVLKKATIVLDSSLLHLFTCILGKAYDSGNLTSEITE